MFLMNGFSLGIKTFVIFILSASTLFGQQTPDDPARNPNLDLIGSSDVDSTETGSLPLDTPVAMTYVLMMDPDIMHTFSDTFVWEDTKHSPLNFYHSHLGNLGSASRLLMPVMDHQIGFDAGWMKYDPYFIHPDSLRYYNQHVPVAKIKYSQASQEDTYISLDFGRSFTQGFNLTLQYDRINQEGEYAHQKQTNTALGIGVWHDAISGKYDAFYNFISNTANAEENGGISDPDLFLMDTAILGPSFPVNVTGGLTSHKERIFTTRQILHITSDTSSIGLDLWIKGQYASHLYKYTDAMAVTVSDYYGPDFFVDQRGIRQYTRHENYEVAGGISLPWNAAHSIVSTALRYRSIDLNQEPENTHLSELFLDAAARFQWVEPLVLTGNLSLGIGKAKGSLLFNVEGILDTRILGQWRGFWSIVNRNPYMIEEKLFINQQLVYNENFKDPFSTEFGVEWNWLKQDLKAGIRWMVFDNFIYFDASRMPSQVDGSFSWRRITINKGFDFKWVGLEGSLVLQPDEKEELAAPNLIYQVSAFGRFKILRKKLTVMPGIDLTYHDGYKGVSYFPVIGQYHLAGDDIPDYFRIDLALGIHINFLKAFLRLEDIAGISKRHLYQSNFYPHYPGYLRIGVEGGFFN